MTAANRSNAQYVRVRAATASNAYVPLASAVFSNPSLGYNLKLNLMGSLVMSTLTFNAKVRTLDCNAVKALGSVHMRVLRRIHGRSRYDANCGSDKSVRVQTGIPSIDCIIQRER